MIKHSNFKMKNIFITLVINAISTALFAQYCPSEAADDADSKCDLVQLNGNTQSINNNTSFSGCETYSDFTSQAIADLNTGQSYSINIMQGTCQDDYDRFCNAWIDFNGDGDFTDAGEALSTGILHHQTQASSILSILAFPLALLVA